MLNSPGIQAASTRPFGYDRSPQQLFLAPFPSVEGFHISNLSKAML